MSNYHSEIRTKNPDRVTKNNKISEELAKAVKSLAAEKGVPFNSLIEEGLRWVLDTYKSEKDFTPPPTPDDRKQLGTTLSDKLYKEVKMRAVKLNTKVNVLMEMAIRYVLEKYNNK